MKPTKRIHTNEILAAIRRIRKIRAAYFGARPCWDCGAVSNCPHREPGITLAELERRVPPATMRAAAETALRLSTCRRIV